LSGWKITGFGIGRPTRNCTGINQSGMQAVTVTPQGVRGVQHDFHVVLAGCCSGKTWRTPRCTPQGPHVWSDASAPSEHCRERSPRFQNHLDAFSGYRVCSRTSLPTSPVIGCRRFDRRRTPDLQTAWPVRDSDSPQQDSLNNSFLGIRFPE